MQREAPNSYELIFSRSKRAAVAQGKLRVYRATLHAVRWLHVVDSKQELVLRVVVVVREERARDSRLHEMKRSLLTYS